MSLPVMYKHLSISPENDHIIKHKSSIIIIVMLLNIFAFIFMKAEAHDSYPYLSIERYFTSYERELDRSLRQLESTRNYDEFSQRLELKLNILQANWEKDRELLKLRAISEGSEESWHREIEKLYLEWEEEANEKVSKAKASYLVHHEYGQLSGSDKAFCETKRRLIEKLSTRYNELLETYSMEYAVRTRETLFQDYRKVAIQDYEMEVESLEGSSRKELESLKNRLKEKGHPERINPVHIEDAFELEKQRYTYENRLFLASLLNSYINRASFDLFSERQSLRPIREEEHARSVANEILRNLEDNLSRSVDERLDALLSEEALKSNEISSISDAIKDFYKKGLKIWEYAAVELVRREQEWYRLYDDVYVEGMDAWVEALGSFGERKERWIEEFSRKVEEGSQNWEDVYTRLNTTGEELLATLRDYGLERQKDFDASIVAISDTLNYGGESVKQIDAYIEEFGFMLRDRISSLVPEGFELKEEQIKMLSNLVKSITMKNDDPSQITLYDPLPFWNPDKEWEKLFNLKTLTVRDEHYFETGTDYFIQEPSCYFLSREAVENGFRLKVMATATIRRYFEYWGGPIGDKGPRLSFSDKQEDLLYYINFVRHGANSWKRSFSYDVIDKSADFTIPVLDVELNTIVNDVEHYLDLIKSLRIDRSSVLKSIQEMQAGAIEKLTSQIIPDEAIFSDEELFNDYYFEGQNEFLMDDIERELLRAYYEKEFWERQQNVIEGVLEYALGGDMDSTRQDIVQAYQEARLRYEEAFESFRELVEGSEVTDGLRQAEEKIEKIIEELEVKKQELSFSDEELRKVINRLTNLRVANANLDMLYRSVKAQIHEAVYQKYTLLESIWQFDESKKDEATGSILAGVLGSSALLYENILNEYFDAGKTSSLVTMERHYKTFRDSIDMLPTLLSTQLPPETSAAEIETLFAEPLREIARSLHLLEVEIKECPLYSELVPIIIRVEKRLNDMAASPEKWCGLKDTGVLAELSGDIYLASSLFEGSIEAKKDAYEELFTHYMNPGEHLRDEQYRYNLAYIDDVKQFLLRRTDEYGFQMGELLEELDVRLKKRVNIIPISEMEAYIGGTLENFAGEMKTRAFDFSEIDPEEGWIEKIGFILMDAGVIERFLKVGDELLKSLEPGDFGTMEEAVTYFTNSLKSALAKNVAVLRATSESFENETEMGGSTIEELMLSLQKQNAEDYYLLKKLFYEIIPGLSYYERTYGFQSSDSIEKKLGFFKDLLPQDLRTLSLLEEFTNEMYEAVETAENLSILEPLNIINRRIEDGYYNRKSDEVQPITGNLDKELLVLFSRLEIFEKNPLLSVKSSSLLQTMADYIASILYLKYGTDFARFDHDERIAIINDKLLDYFSLLSEKAGELDFSEAEQKEIETGISRLLFNTPEAFGPISFKALVNERVNELVDGIYPDYRGVIYAEKDLIEDKELLKNLYSIEDVDPQEISSAMSYVVLENSSPDKVLSGIYFEGSGIYGYRYNNDKSSGTVHTAITYVTGNRAINNYIESQNRFIQILLSLTNLKKLVSDSASESIPSSLPCDSIREIAEEYMNGLLAEHNIGISDIDIFTDPRFKGIIETQKDADLARTLFETLAGVLWEKKNLLTLLNSSIITRDRDGMRITKSSFFDDELLYMLASAGDIKSTGADLNYEIRVAEEEVLKQEEAVDSLRYDVNSTEGRLSIAREVYNKIVSRLNGIKKEVDQSYQEYLTAKEKYFYALNIYLYEDASLDAFKMYRNQICNYAAERARAEERYALLKSIKVKEVTAEKREDELDALEKELELLGSSLNETEEALILLRIFYQALSGKLSTLKDKLKVVEDALKSSELPEKRIEELEGIRRNLKLEIGMLEKIDDQYVAVDLSKGKEAYKILHEALDQSSTVEEEAIDGYIKILREFILKSGTEVFKSTSTHTVSMMVVELEDYLGDQEKRYQSSLTKSMRAHEERFDSFYSALSDYTEYMSLLSRYRTEQNLIEHEIGYFVSRLSSKEQKVYDGYIESYRGRWDDLNEKDIEEKYLNLIGLERRREEVQELILVYRYLSGSLDKDEITPEEKELWGADLSKLKEKYSLNENEIFRYTELLTEGITISQFDLSYTGLLKKELNRRIELINRVYPLGNYNTLTVSNLFLDIFSCLKDAFMKVDKDRTSFEQDRFALQIGSVSQEKARYQQKFMLGRAKGLSEWDKQLHRLNNAYWSWLDGMKKRFIEGEEEWYKKETEYIRKQNEWVEDVQRSDDQTKNKSLLTAEKAVEELLESIGVEITDLRVNSRDIESEYINDVAVPQWVGDYEVLANLLFTPLKKKAPTLAVVQEVITGLRDRIALFTERKEELETERLYFKLIKARDTILAEIRSLNEGYRAMIEEVLVKGGFKKEGSGYTKRVFSDYSLLFGKKYRNERIDLFKPYSIDKKKFSLGGIERLRSEGDSVDQQIYVLREVERLRIAKEEILGDENKVGSVYLRHIGRFPTQDETERYVEENQKNGLSGLLKGIMGNLISNVFTLFGNNEKAENKDDFNEFQKKLQVGISYGMNMSLETGRIILEYQRLVVLEAEAESKKDAGFFNTPIIPGGPSLKSIGSVTLAVATAGTSGVMQGIAQTGWSTFTTMSTAIEGHIEWEEAALNILKDAGVRALGGSFSINNKSIGEMTLKDLGSVSSNISGVVKKGLLDSGRNLITQAAISGVNAFGLDDHGRLIWSEDSFTAGLGKGIASSIGVLGGSIVGSSYDVAHGAEWSNGAFNYHYMRDTSKGVLIQDYYNLDMKRVGNLMGGLTEQLIDNAMGVSDGIALNVFNARDFGMKHDVGLLEVTLGGRDGFRWDVSTSGLDVSLSGIGKTIEGSERLKLYNKIMGGDGVNLKVAYLTENKLHYSWDELSEDEKEAYEKDFQRMFNELSGYLAGNSTLGLELESNLNRREGDSIHISSEYFKADRFGAEGRIVELGLNDAAKIASLIAHELMHDGQKNMDEIHEDIIAHGFDAVVWKGLKEKFGVYSSEMDEKLLAYEYFGSEGFEEYLSQRYVLGDDANLLKDWNVEARLKFIEARVLKDKLLGKETPSEAIAYYSLMKGFRGKGEEWTRMYDELGIMPVAQRRIVWLMGQGYELLKGEEGIVKETDVIEVNLGNATPIEGYIFLSQMKSLLSRVDGAVLTQRFGVENENGLRSIQSDFYTLAYSGFAEGILESTMGKHVKDFIEFIHVLENPSTLKKVISSSYEDIQRSLTEEEGWVEAPWLQGEYKKCLKAQCNLGSANVLKLLGFDRYYGEKYSGAANLTKDPRTGNEILAADIIDDLMALDDFVPVDEVLDFKNIKTPEELFGALSELKNYAILTMKNLLGEPSHMAVLIGGESYDVNYRSKDKYGSVPLWVTMRGMSNLNKILGTSLQYNSFNFINSWIQNQIETIYMGMTTQEAIKKSFDDYKNYFGSFKYEILIPEYSTLYYMSLENIWELLDSYK